MSTTQQQDWSRFLTNRGESLKTLSDASPVLLVFLRHAGCTFCLQTLGDISKHRQEIEANGASIAIVAMSADARIGPLLKHYGLGDIPWISDPNRECYSAFQLRRGTLWEVAGPAMWGKAIGSLLAGHVPALPDADIRQLPGAFLIHQGRILKEFRPQSSGDRANYVEMACPV